MSIREKIKNAHDIKKEVMKIDVWDCDIEVRTMMASDRADILNSVMTDDGKIDHKKFHAMMIVSACYEPGTDDLIFNPEDIEWLMQKSAGPIEKLAGKAMELSGLSKEAIGEAEKN